MAVGPEKTVKFFFCLLLTLCLITGKIFTTAEKTLRMVNLVYRHGDRSQISSYANDPYIKYWPQGPGQLTQVGMNQEYKLGQFLKNRYMKTNKLLNATYIKNQVYCRSTDKDRTIMSAQAQLNGLYPPSGKQEWRGNLDWQPIPVHVVPLEMDNALSSHAICPAYTKLMQESLEEKEYKNFEQKFKNLFTSLGPHVTGKNRTLTIRRAADLRDTLFCQQSHNLTLPNWVNTSMMEKLDKVSEFDMYWDFHNDDLARLKGGPLLGEIMKHMTSYVNKEPDVRKAYIYSAHDTTVMSLLSALKLYNRVVPAYSSALLVELYTNEKGEDPSVQVHYRFGQSDTAKQLVLNGCQADCPFQTFTRLTRSMIPEDIKSACGLKNKTCVKTIIYKSFLIAFASTLGIAVVLAVCLCWCWCKRRRSISRASHVKFDDGLLRNASLLGNQDYDSDS